MANATRKTFSASGMREPRTASAPSANAMSVAIGMPQPLAPAPSKLIR